MHADGHWATHWWGWGGVGDGTWGAEGAGTGLAKWGGNGDDLHTGTLAGL